MKNLALGACVIAIIAACGGGGGKVTLLDAAVDAMFVCNPVAQTGCKSGEKCTWLVDVDATMTTNEIGHIGCVPANAATATPEGNSCMNALAGMNGGADTCVAGDLCISNKCKPICDPQIVDGAAAGACKTNFACSIYAGVFTSGVGATAGVCEPTCDPLTQKLNAGTTNLDACGSSNAAQPSGTCVVSGGFRSFHCAPSGSSLYGKTDRQPPLTDQSGRYFGNGCAPGFIPFFFEDASGSMKTLCSGLCAPMKVDMTIAADAAHKDDNRGDKTALGKLPTDPAPTAGKSTCDAGVKGSAVSSAHGEDCRYVWFPLAHDDPTMALQTPFNDTLGICFAYEKFLDITIPGNPQKQPEKSCADLPVTAPMTDPFGSAKENGCYPLAESRRAIGRTSRTALATFRFASGTVPATRHIFE